MSFFLAPIIFVFELIGFLISAAFVYGLLLIAAITIIWYGMIELKSREIIVEYVNVIEETVEKTSELTCKRLSGCKTFPNAKTEKEYCPTCVWEPEKLKKVFTSSPAVYSSNAEKPKIRK